jgi:hypothetical protein
MRVVKIVHSSKDKGSVSGADRRREKTRKLAAHEKIAAGFGR